MKNLQKAGGVSALISAGGYIIGMVVAIIFLAPVFEYAPDKYIEFLTKNLNLMYLWHVAIYIIPGVVLVPLTLGIYEQIKGESPGLSQVAAAFGLIWSGLVIATGMLLIKDAIVVVDLFKENKDQAITVFQTLGAVEDALGGGIELPGGIWLLLSSVAALRASVFAKWVNYLGIIVGVAGIITVVPALYDAVNIFGLGLIIWFISVGIYMLRKVNK